MIKTTKIIDKEEMIVRILEDTKEGWLVADLIDKIDKEDSKIE
jgi:hypothetical protein